MAEQPPARPQPDEGGTYAPKLTRDNGRIDWSRDATYIERQVRALNPWPGTWTTLGGETLKVLATTSATGDGAPGTVLDTALSVACGHGAVRLERLQRPGRGPLDRAAFLRGHAVVPGTRLGA